MIIPSAPREMKNVNSLVSAWDPKVLSLNSKMDVCIPYPDISTFMMAEIPLHFNLPISFKESVQTGIINILTTSVP